MVQNKAKEKRQLTWGYIHGPTKIDGSDRQSFEITVPFKRLSPKLDIGGDGLITTQLKSSAVLNHSDGKLFYGVDIGAGAAFIFGIKIKFKFGFYQ